MRIWLTSNSMTMYGSHQHCVRCMLSRLPLTASLDWETLAGEMEEATFACWDERAAWTTAGTELPCGTEMPSAQRTRMERMPVRKWGLSSPGVGVIERVDAASSRSAERVAFLLFPSFQDMIKGEDVSNIVRYPGQEE